MRTGSKILALLAVAVAVFGRPLATCLFKLNHTPPDEEVGLIPHLSSQEVSLGTDRRARLLPPPGGRRNGYLPKRRPLSLRGTLSLS